LNAITHIIKKLSDLPKMIAPLWHRICITALTNTTSDTLRNAGVDTLRTLIGMSDRVDWLISELVKDAKNPHPGVTKAMLEGLYEVVSKAGSKMSKASRQSILGLIDADEGEEDSMAITHARLLGALIKVLPSETTHDLIESRILTTNFGRESILALNAVLADAPEAIGETFAEETSSIIAQGIKQGVSGPHDFEIANRRRLRLCLTTPFLPLESFCFRRRYPRHLRLQSPCLKL
jgi:hypothetical protein